MKVLVLLDNPYISDQRVEREISVLNELGINTVVLAMMIEGKEEDVIKGDVKVMRILDPLLKSPLRPSYKKTTQTILVKILKLDFDVIHCHDYHLLPLAARIIKKRPWVKLIYDSHEYFAGWPVYKDTNGVINRIKSFIVWGWLLYKEKLIARNAYGIICTTESIKNKLKIRFGNYPRYISIRNIPDFRFPNKNFYLNDYFKLEHQTKIIIHSGNIYFSDADFVVLAKTIYSIPNYALIFLLNSEKIKYYQQIMNTHGIDKNVYFHHYVDRNKLANILASATMGLVFVKTQWPSHKLASPNRLMEYILSGIPVISNYNYEAESIIKSQECGVLVKCIKSTELFNAIKCIEKNYNKYSINTKNARNNFSWTTEKEKLIHLYQQIQLNE